MEILLAILGAAVSVAVLISFFTIKNDVERIKGIQATHLRILAKIAKAQGVPAEDVAAELTELDKYLNRRWK